MHPSSAIRRPLWTVAIAVAAMLGPACSREPAPAPAAKNIQPSTLVLTQATGARAMVVDGSGSALPQVGNAPPYIGSAACRDCHEDQFKSWHRSYHRTMTQLAVPGAVQADFNNVVLTNDGIRFTLRQQSNEFRVFIEATGTPPPGMIVPEPADVRVGLVTGSHHMQVFWIPDEEHNSQSGFPFTWLIPEQKWVPRNSTFIRPPSMQHRSETWNFVCARCHATGVEPGLDRAALNWHTEVGELGTSCEACHGPGDRHVQARRRDKDRAVEPDAATLLAEIVQPKKLDPVRGSQVCGFCHSMKHWDSAGGWPVKAFAYRPGDDLEATTPVMRPKELAMQPWLRKALESNPGIFRDFFWADGMIRVSGREYNGLIDSPCYKGGSFSCLSCHSPHDSEPDDQLLANRKDQRACTQCHEAFRDPAQLTAHTRHAAASTGSDCYNCHMPHTTYGVLKAIRSHQVSSPRVADEIATGRPNACNLCHLDKPLAWTAGHLGQWFRQPVPSLSGNLTNLADSVRLALTGDAGQRALLAWHFGWGPAVNASGRGWIPPILGQLLDDPYAAVRCVAERSLKQVAPALVPPGYDYTVAPEERASGLIGLIENWAKTVPRATPPGASLPPASGLQVDDLPGTVAALQALGRTRDESPVRLRE